MTTGMRTLPALLGLALISTSGSALAAPKKAGKAAPACGAKVLPLVVGNSWTYAPGVAPQPILPELTKIAPRQAAKIVITVKSVETKGADTVVALEEKVTYEITPAQEKKNAVIADVVVNSTITCNKTKFEISPDSFFFAAEPGGYRELQFDTVTRSKDTSLKLAGGTIGDDQWREDIVAHFTRVPAKGIDVKMSPGKLELERVFTPETPEDVSTKNGQRYPRAEKVALVTTGRVTFDAPVSPRPEPSQLPANWISRFWFAPDVGLVQSLNMYAHLYQLVDSTLN